MEEDGGWHFSYLMNENEIKLKLSRLPGEVKRVLKNNKEEQNLYKIENIKKKINNLIDPYGRKDILLKKVEIDESFPEHVYKNIEELEEFIAK